MRARCSSPPPYSCPWTGVRLWRAICGIPGSRPELPGRAGPGREPVLGGAHRGGQQVLCRAQGRRGLHRWQEGVLHLCLLGHLRGGGQQSVETTGLGGRRALGVRGQGKGGATVNMKGFGEDGDPKNCSTKGARVLCSGSSRSSSLLRFALTRGARPSGLTSGPENRGCSASSSGATNLISFLPRFSKATLRPAFLRFTLLKNFFLVPLLPEFASFARMLDLTWGFLPSRPKLGDRCQNREM